MPEIEVESYANAIRGLHGGEPVFVESVLVTETWEGETVWTGMVHVFDLEGNDRGATRAYTWSAAVEGSANRKFTAVLHEGNVDSPRRAVQAAILSQSPEEENI